MKTCVRCGEDCPRENFYAQKRMRDGLDSWCKKCHSEARRERYRNNTEYERARNRAWDKANPEKVRAKARRQYVIHREKSMARTRAWKAANPERWKAIQKSGEIARRGREKNAAGSASADQVQARIDLYANRCWICGGPATEIDHVIPLARGGTNWPANLRPACRSCNARKGARSFTLEAVA